MEICQSGLLKITKISDADAFMEFMEEEGGFFTESMDDDVSDCVEIEFMDEYEVFEDMLNILKNIVSNYKGVELNLEGEEESTYDGFKYVIEYKGGVMTVKSSDRFYFRAPEDYDKFVECCEEFNIKDIMDEDEWEQLGVEEWFFVDGDSARTSIDLTNIEKITI